MTTNAETFVVKLNFDGQMRRFPVPRGTSFKELREQVVALLSLPKDSDVLLKYSDEEGDLITLSSDLELNSALVPGKLLRLSVVEKRNVGHSNTDYAVGSATYPLIDAPMYDVPAPTPNAPPQGADVFRAFLDGCGGGFTTPHHPHPPMFAPHPPPGFGPHEGFGPHGGFGAHDGHGPRGFAPHHRGGFGPRGGHFGRGGPHRGGFGPRGDFHGHGHTPYPHPRHHMTPEERQQFKKERKEAHKEMKRQWKEAHKCMKKGAMEAREFRCADGMQWGWGSQNGAPVDRMIARFAKDVTIPDGTQLAPNTPFVKTWRLRNEGAEWPAGCVLQFLGKKSDNMGGPATVPLPTQGPIAPNSEVDVSVNLMAPQKPGRYTGYWKMCTPEGRRFGQRVWVSIVVPGTTSSSSSSSDSDREADKYEELVDAVLATGLSAKRHRVFRMLQKNKGNVNLVCEKLAQKEEKRARKAMKKQMKL